MESYVKDSNLSSITSQVNSDGSLQLNIAGRLDSNTTGKIWRQAKNEVEKNSPRNLVIDASGINYCDGAGIALLFELQLHQQKAGKEIEIRGLANEFQQLLDQFKAGEFIEAEVEVPGPSNIFEKVGRSTLDILQDFKANISFLGEVMVSLFYAMLHPRSVRWKDFLITSELIGVNAFSIVALVCFLIGLVMAFQSAIPMQQYGAQLFVANLIVIAMFKELGPLMTAWVVNGRSASAFAAELGTMKVNEEIDALTTMGLEPVRFLVVPRVLAALVMIPILTIFGNLFGLIGGLVVMLSLGFSVVTYVNQITSAATYVMLLAGLIKSVVFAFIIGGVGCMEGLRTKTGASAVGDSTTSAVVVGLVMIIFVDGVFGVIYYFLGI
ncbi:ABC transporter permease [Desulfobacterota bacterium AH_259_B03_O07]|nr:ABC transporter permease [Desulfobacterota bacterium AH_259_B03_O07]